MHLHDSEVIGDLGSAELEVGLSSDQLVQRRCGEALRKEEAGDYEAARSILVEFWPGLGERPILTGLGDEARAELLIRCGALAGKIGRAQQVKGAQEMAKDLLSQSSRVFDKLGATEKVAEAQLELAICYFREGGLDEARDTLKHAIRKNPNVQSEQRLKSLLTLGIFESSASRSHEALRIYSELAPLLNGNSNHLLRGSFHNEYALVYKNLGRAEKRADYIDRAFIEYAAASYHFERADHTRYLAFVENNLGYLFLTAKKPLEAHQHLNRARALFIKLRDKGSIAQVDETRARAFLAQNLNSQAETTARAAVHTFEQGDQAALLAEALITHGTALARLERFERAYAQLKRALDLATEAGNKEKAGLAALTIVENLSNYVPPAGTKKFYQDAEALLADSQEADTDERLGQCARKVLALSEIDEPRLSMPIQDRTTDESDSTDPVRAAQAWNGGSLEQAVLEYERELIHRALDSVSGSVTRAARMLGITHQGLAFILNGRHKSLLTVRTPVRRRRKSILRAQ